MTFDLDFYWIAVGSILIMLAGQWGFKRVRSLLNSR